MNNTIGDVLNFAGYVRRQLSGIGRAVALISCKPVVELGHVTRKLRLAVKGMLTGLVGFLQNIEYF